MHLLDAVVGILKTPPQWVLALDASHMSVVIGMQGGPLIQIDALGECARTFRLDFYGTRQNSSHDITDNFSMFRRMLWHFHRAVLTGKPAIDPRETLGIMRMLMAGRISRQENRRVFLDEIRV